MEAAVAWQPNVRILPGYDVVVCGGGPAGCAAALAAARQGLSVLLVEGQGQLGGMGTSGLVSHWLGGRNSQGPGWVVGGIFRELALAAVERGIALLPEPEPDGRLSPHGWCKGGTLTAGIPFDPFAMAVLLDEVMATAGVDVLLCTRAVDVIQRGDAIEQVVIHHKSGFQAIPVKAVIDATGDADLAALSGCETILGRDGDNLMTPVTLQLHLEQVDAQALAEYANRSGRDGFRFLEEIQELMCQGEWPFLYNRLISVQLTEPDTFMLNTSRIVGCDGTDGASISQAMAQGRRESQQLLGILRRHVPGFAKARIKAVAPLLGVRETRRIVGDFVLTVQALVEGEPLRDVIGLSDYGWDLPDPRRPSDNPNVGHQRGVKRRVLEIPYRIMVPGPVRNLICPGRAVSVERDLLGPLRVMAPCMAMGEAAGIASAQVVRRKLPFGEIDVPELQTALRQAGAILSLPAEETTPHA